MRKPVYLVLLGFSIVVAAVSLGVSLTRFLGLLAYSPKGTAQAGATSAGSTISATPVEDWTNLFAPGDGMKMASRLPAVDAKTGSQTPRTRFVLVGTIASSSPASRRAILWANGMKEPKAFRETEEVEPGAFLASVERDKVWITRGKEREKLEILPVGSHGRPAATAARPVPPPVAAAAPPPAFPTDASTLPSITPARPPIPDRTQAVAAPKDSKDSSEAAEDEGLSTRERRRRSRASQ